MRRLLWLGVIAALTMTALALPGCGGGGDSSYNPPEVLTGTISGHVVQADEVTVGLANVQVTVTPAATAGAQTAQAITTRTDSQGAYTLVGVPVGTQAVLAERTTDANYRSQAIPGVSVSADTTTRLNIALLRQDEAEPNSVQLSPTSAVVDLNGQVKFTGAAGSGGATPSFLVVGGIGTVSAGGLFTATRTGTGEIRAFSGNAKAVAAIEVTPARAPEVSSFLISPLSLSASGGSVSLTAAVNDGDGVSHVVAEIYPPAGDTIQLDLPLESGNAKDGTYRTSHVLPANSNTPNSSGVQAPMKYSVRLVVTDGSGAQTATDFADVTVKGLQSPPPPI
jgi:hypothetical protein